MIIQVDFQYPMDKWQEVAEIFNNLPPVPDFMTMRGPYSAAAVGIGVKGFNTYEFDIDRMKDGLEVVSKRYRPYAAVVGYTFEMKPYYNVEEATKAMEME